MPSQGNDIIQKLISMPVEPRRKVMRRFREGGIDLNRLALPHLGIKTPCKLSHAQERLWFLWHLEGGSAAYNIAGGVRLSGVLDEVSLSLAFAGLIERHEVLRTTFEGGPEGGGLQRIHAAMPLVIGRSDLTGMCVAEQELRVQELMAAEAAAPFDLQAGPLLRVRLLECSAREHVLLVTLHHIVSDGWSMQVLVEEFVALYGSLASGHGPALAALPIQYADYAIWQRAWLEAGESERQLAYWQEKLGTEHAVLELPVDHARTSVRNDRGGSCRVRIDAALTARLRALGQAQQATLFMVLLAGFKGLLYRYTGAGEIRVGSPTANRTRVETEGLIGVFVNTLVLSTAVDGQLSFVGLLARVRETVLGAQSHQDLPFEQLVEALQPQRSLMHHPLFQVLFNAARGQPGGVLRGLKDLQVQLLEPAAAAVKFDLSVDVMEERQEVACTFSYAAQLFEASTIERLAGHWLNLLAAAVAAPTAPLGNLTLLSGGEWTQQQGWSCGERIEQPGCCLHELIEAQVRAQPQAIAVVYENRTLTYGQLNARANRLARYLRSVGVGPEVLVGLAVERSLEMVVGLLGVLKAGGAYVPLDPGYPPERLAFMIADAGVALVLTQAHLLEHLASHTVLGVARSLWCLDRDWHQVQAYAQSDLVNRTTPQNLAYCIYTSGSTGKPKGASNTHAGIVNRLRWMRSLHEPRDTDRILHKTPFSFDVSVWELFWPLIHGVQLVIAPPEAHRDPRQLSEVIRAQRVTIMHFVPSMLQAFLDSREDELLPSLDKVMCSGEALSLELQQAFRQRYAAQLYNLYGPTEASIEVSHWRCREEPEASSVPIGRPIWNTQLYILDADLNPVPVGVVGELYIGGVSLARSYHRRPGLTAERFVPNPYAVKGERLYRTGDQVRWRADGAIEYRGRLDSQIKVRGFRIELTEIERGLLAHPDVHEAAVVAREGPAGKQLVAYLVPHHPVGTGLLERVRQHLRARLPEYMVPAQLMALDALPLSANGKLDRRALPEPDRPRVEYIAPRTANEESLAAIWREVLGLERVGVTENFFELGGDSILSLQVVARARRVGLTLTAMQLFEWQTLEGLAAVAQQSLTAPEAAPMERDVSARTTLTPADVPLSGLTQAQIDALPVPAQEIEDIYPLSPMQQGMLFQTLHAPEAGHYVNQLSVPVQGLELDRFEAAWSRVTGRHGALRTSFVWEGDIPAPLQIVHKRVAPSFEEIDWRDREVGESQLTELAVAERTRGFNLTEAPLQRMTVVKLAGGSHHLIWTQHHLLLDGWSSARQVEEALAHYLGETVGPVSGRYRAYIAWLAQQDREASQRFWLLQLRKLEEPTLLAVALNRGGIRPPGGQLEGGPRGQALCRLDAQATAQLTGFAHRERVTLNTVIQGAWVLLLQRYCGQRTVAFGATVAGRPADLPGAQEMLGLFINTLPVVQSPRPEQTLGPWLRELQSQNAALRAHEHVPLYDLQRWAGHAGQALFDTLVVFENYPLDEALRTRSGRTLTFGAARTQILNTYPLTLKLRVAGEVEGALIYEQDLFDGSSIEEIKACWLHLVSQLTTARSDRPLGAFTLLPPARRKQVIERWSHGDVVEGARECLPTLIERWARVRPDALAVVHEDATLTFQQLDARARRLAERLRARGIGPDVLVGLAVERSLELVVGLLGILKAGGAYVPLDLQHPPQRIRHLLHRNHITVVVTCGDEPRTDAFEDVVLLPIEDNDADPKHVLESTPQLSVDNLAYVIFTSGSSGEPKGVAVTHRSLVNYVQGVVPRLRIDGTVSMAMVSTPSADLGHTVLFGALLSGATLHLISVERVSDAPSFALYMQQHRIDVLKIAPTHFSALAHTTDVSAVTPKRTLVLGGEPCDSELVKAVQMACPACHVVNHYGPTESTVGVLTFEVPDEFSQPGVPLGRPLANTKVYVLTAELDPLPPGAVGELYLGGEGLARGYHRQPGLTAERFVPDPFATMAGGRLYRTGDQVRWGVDGVIEYVGRLDGQVKLRGFRVEPSEIAAQLLTHEWVRDAVVVVRDMPTGKQLIGYVVPAGDTPRGWLDRLREHLGAVLPHYMVPTQLRELAALPRTPNGKLDRSALPEPGPATTHSRPPRTQIEATLAAIWRDVLRLDQVGVTDNFFELGGDSILSLQIIARARRAGLKVTPKQLFERQTIEGLALVAQPVVVDASAETSRDVGARTRLTPEDVPLAGLTQAQIDTLPVPVHDIEDVYPLAPMQQGLLFHVLHAPQAGHYVNQMSVHLDGLDFDRFKAAWAAVIARHGILRTSFAWEGDLPGPIQIVRRHVSLAIEELDWRDRAVSAADLTALAAADHTRDFDLSEAPLQRLTVVRLPGGSHQLIWTHHHLLLDGWSTARQIEEVFAHYLREPLRPPAGRYAEYIAWLRRQDSAASEQFWRDQLRMVEGPTLLAAAVEGGRVHPVVREEVVVTREGPDGRASVARPELPAQLRGESVLRLPPDATRRLQRYAQRERVTLNTLVQGAWVLLLQRYCGQRTVVFGSTVAGRPADLPGAQEMLGLFINTLPVVQSPPSEQRVGAWLRELQTQNLLLREHEHIALNEVQRWAGHAGQTLFDTIMVFENYPVDEALRARSNQALRIGVPVTVETTHYAMTVSIRAAEQLEMSFSYRETDFDAVQIAALKGHVLHLLDSMIVASDPPLGELGLMHADECVEIVENWGRGETVAPDLRCLHELVEARVRERPHAPAVICGETTLTYTELNARANQLARHLRSQGVGPDALVGIAAERSLEMIVGMLGILKAGGAYVPLDPTYPTDRLAFMIEDAQVEWILTQEHLVERLSQSIAARQVALWCLDRDWDQVRGLVSTDLAPRSAVENLAYCIYTSGSTGWPKGVCITHAALINHERWIADYAPLSAADRALQNTPISFDGSIFEYWSQILSGGTCVLSNPHIRRDPQVILEEMARYGITVFQTVPSFLLALMEADEARQLAHLHFVYVGGEVLPLEVQRQFIERYGAKLHNAYGPTEATVEVTCWACRGDEIRSVPIGRPIWNTQLLLLDESLSPVPRGVVGELYIGGASLARGYHNRAVLTAERFVPNPFAKTPGERLYRTGDLARWRTDGSVEYVGRADGQVKLRGFRVELGEIEAQLLAQAPVREAVVIARESGVGKQLVGYVVLHGNADGEGTARMLEGLTQHLKTVLPQYMVPAHLVALALLPLTPGGKVDRRALPEPQALTPGYVGPRNEIERQLVAIWQAVLGVPRVSATDNFFALGGDSILALQIIARARRAGWKLTPRQLFERQTIAELALVSQVIAQAAPAQEAIDLASRMSLAPSDIPLSGLGQPQIDALPVPAHEIEDIYPLSPMQHGLLFHALHAPQAGHYINQLSVQVTGLDVARLTVAWSEVTARHAILRTSFVWEGDVPGPLQIVHKRVPLMLAELDWRDRGLDDGELDHLVAEDRARGFDLTKAPLQRMTVVQLASGAHQLIWTHHHLLLDGWSAARQIEELLAHYRGESLPRAAGRYGEYIGWLSRQDREASERFWLARLRTLDTPTLLADALGAVRRQLKSTDEDPGARTQLMFRLSPETTHRLVAFAQVERVTLNTLLQAAWALLLQRYCDRPTVVFGVTVAGRPAEVPGAQEMLGLFINTLPVIQSPRPEEAVGTWLRALQADNLALREQEHVPLNDVQRWAGRPGHALFDTLVVFENYPVDEALRARTGDTLQFGTVANLETTHYSMTVSAHAAEQLQITLSYDPACFAVEQIQGLQRHVLRLLEELTVDTTRSIGMLPLLARDEQARVVEEWGRGPTVSVDTWCLHELIEVRVRQQPQAIAVMSADESLTYAELNARANRLARYLRSHGVGPDVLVGVAMSRSPAMLVSLLAILKAGGAYVPLDPAYPTDRLTFMIEDAGLSWVVTQSDLLARLGLAGDGVGSTDESHARAAISGRRASVWCVDRDWHELEAGGDTDLVNLAAPANLAYCIYTSGSTGRPKGVGISHAALVSHEQWLASYVALTAADCALQFTPVSFDASIFEYWSPLLAGGRCALSDAHAQHDPQVILREIERFGVTVLQTGPSFLLALIESDEARRLQQLRYVCLGGEACPIEVQRLFMQRNGGELHNTYGPTEATIEVSHWSCREDPASRSVPIGRPIWNTQLLILDASLSPVPVGVMGELYIGGAGLARGYHCRAGLTAERFVPNPFGGTLGERLYRTGDRARWRADGAIEFIGRLDDQVKVHGLRIELGEIETQLRAHPEVREAVVLTREGTVGQQLVGYLVPRAATAAQLPERLKAQLATVLPAYMVPAHLVELATLPLLPNGKLDRKALPQPYGAPAQYVPPRTEVEAGLAGIWQAVLGVDRVGVRDNFFELGGDSILSLQIIARARRAGLKLTPRQVFEKQTVAELAAVAERIEPRKASSSASAPVSGAMPLTPIQLEFFAQAVPHRHHWNQSVLLRVRERLDEGALERALQGVLVHHDALRLRYREDLSGGWSAVHAEASEEARGLLWVREAGSAADAHGLYEQAQRSLSLEEGPLLRAVYVRLADGSARLLLVIHHLVVDGVSWRVLLEDLQSLYGQQVRGEVLTLPSQTSAFQAWAERLRRYAGSQELAAELPYWRAQLDPNGLRELPRDHSSPAGSVLDAARAELRLDRYLTLQLLKHAPEAYRTQVNDLLLTALARMLCRWSDSSSVLIALEGHGREDLFEELDLSRTVGWFTSVFPVRLTPPLALVREGQAAPDLGTAVKAIKEQLRAIPHRGVGYGVLKFLSEDSWRSQLDGLAVPRVTFNYLGQFDNSFAPDVLFVPAQEAAGAGRDPNGRLAAWLSVDGQVYDGELRLSFTYSRRMYEPATVETLARMYQKELEALIGHCADERVGGLTPSDVPLARLSQAQLDALPLQAREIEDVYPLSPMQQGILFHTLHNPQAGHYVNQLSIPVEGLDLERFTTAWQVVIARHAILRTRFIWEGDLPGPLQIVHKTVPSGIVELDWRDRFVSAVELRALAAAERARGFDLTTAPLQRMTVVQLAGGTHHLIWTHHHLLLDGWSAARQIEEAFAQYVGQNLAPVSGRFREYIAWLGCQDRNAGERFWLSQLRALEEPTLLAGALGGMCSRAPGACQDEGPGELLCRIERQTTRRLLEFTHRERVTVNTLVQGIWALLLQRYCRQDTVAFGVTVAGRPADLPGSQDMLGLFINTLPVIQRPPPEQPVGAWLRELQAQNLTLREHEHVPLYELHRWAARAGQALFDTIVVFENYPVDAALRARCGQSLRFGTASLFETTHYPMTVTVQLGEQLQIGFSFNPAHFELAQIMALQRHLLRLMDAVLMDSACCLGELPMLTPEEQTQIVALSHGAKAPFECACAHELIARQARQAPDALAVITADAQLSYGQLNARANRLAHWLIEQGVGPDVPVAIAAQRSMELVVGLLGIMKAGGTYVPLDPDYPAERLSYMLHDSGVQLVLTQQHLLDTLPGGQPRLWCLDRDAAQLEAYEDSDPVTRTDPQHLAYCIYTSGSSGQPKGTGNTHAALVNRLMWMQSAYALTAADRVLQKTPFSFDVSVWEFFWPLTSGAVLVMAPPGVHRDPDRLAATIREHAVTTLHFVPSMLHVFLASAQLSTCGTVRQVMCSGEALSLQTQREFGLQHGAKLHNLYGPTEAAIDVSAWECIDEEDARGVPIGRPIANLSLHVLDTNLNPVPTGVVGEIYIGGAGLARGYWNRAGLTAERFVPDPLGQSGERLYRTGDLGRWRNDGAMEYVGRGDQQVKIHGFRIELGEIETQLRCLQAVREAAVVRVEAPSGVMLVAYVLADTGSLSEERLREQLRRVLPEFMVPARIRVLDHFPLTPSGKLDRRALPMPEPVRAAYVAPASDLERRVARIWQDVMAIDRVGITDDFFDLGGDSILAMRLIVELRQRGFPAVTLGDLIQARSIGALLQSIRVQRGGGAEDFAIHLNETASTPVIYCLPPFSGQVNCYMRFATAAREHFEVIAFEAACLNDFRQVERSIEEAVEPYARYILAHHRTRDCYLLGWSWGGVLAHALAVRLQGQVEIHFVGMIEAYDFYALFCDNLGRLPGFVDPRMEAEITDRMRRSEMASEWAQLLEQLNQDERDGLVKYCTARTDLWSARRAHPYSEEYETYAIFNRAVISKRYTFQPLRLPIKTWVAGGSDPFARAPIDWSRVSPAAEPPEVIDGAGHTSIITSQALHASVLGCMRKHLDRVVPSGTGTA